MKKFSTLLLFVLVVAILLAVTCPSRDDHCNELKNKIVNRYLNSDDGEPLGAFLVGGFTSLYSQAAMHYDNYTIFSVGSMNIPDSTQIQTIGVLGHVFVLK